MRRPTTPPPSRPPAPRAPPRRGGDGGKGEDDEVVAEAVAELDPALAEVHEVDDGDRCERQGGAGDEARPAKLEEGGQDEQIGRARQEDAHPDRAGHRDRTLEVEQAADGALEGAQGPPDAAERIRRLGPKDG